MDIRSKLGMYKENKLGSASVVAAQAVNKSMPDMLNGHEEDNGTGAFYVFENMFKSDQIHGGCVLGHALKISENSLGMLLGGQEHSAASMERFLFLDTETTGLSGGAGTVAFLLGTGFFEKGCFITRQLFMRDYDEEYAVLYKLNSMLAKFDGIITFNGKSFDWNLINSRFISNRIKPLLKEPMHIDLLHVSRKIWGLGLQSCKLSSLEENILGEQRHEDIPGYMIPSVYFKYLEDRDVSDIVKVIQHNKLDILSMVSLIIRISLMLENPFSQAIESRELFGLGKLYEKCGKKSNSVKCYESCTESSDYSAKAAAVKRLVKLYKKDGEHEKAAEHLHNMTDITKGFDVMYFIELAIYYEHRKKDYKKALFIVDTAVEQIFETGSTDSPLLTELRRRQARLQRKSDITAAKAARASSS